MPNYFKKGVDTIKSRIIQNFNPILIPIQDSAKKVKNSKIKNISSLKEYLELSGWNFFQPLEYYVGKCKAFSIIIYRY